jgi:hypothetical protein
MKLMSEIYALPHLEGHVLIVELEKLRVSSDKVRRKLFRENSELKKQLSTLRAEIDEIKQGLAKDRFNEAEPTLWVHAREN